MPKVTFTREEIIEAFPRAINGGKGTASAWQMFSTEGSATAAHVVRNTMIHMLTAGFHTLDPDTIGHDLWLAAIGCVRGQCGGECYGLSDSEPQLAFLSFARRLFNTVEQG